MGLTSGLGVIQTRCSLSIDFFSFFFSFIFGVIHIKGVKGETGRPSRVQNSVILQYRFPARSKVKDGPDLQLELQHLHMTHS